MLATESEMITLVEAFKENNSIPKIFEETKHAEGPCTIN